MDQGYTSGSQIEDRYSVSSCNVDYTSGRQPTSVLTRYVSFGDLSEYKGSLIPDWDSMGEYNDGSEKEVYEPRGQKCECAH